MFGVSGYVTVWGEMTDLILIRHGETDWNKNNLIQGQQDIPLNAKGREQAAGLAPLLESFQAETIWSSDLVRAVQTAELATCLDQDHFSICPNLRERCFGVYETRSRSYIREHFDPTFFLGIHGEPGNPIEGGESIESFQSRSVTAIESIAAQEAGKRIAIFTHGGVIRAWMCHLFHIPMTAPRRFEIRNSSIHRFVSDPELKWVAQSIGDIPVIEYS